MFDIQQFDSALSLRQVALLAGASGFLNAIYSFRYSHASDIEEIDRGISARFETKKWISCTNTDGD